MTLNRKQKIFVGGAAALAIAGGGAALAATELSSPSERSAAIVTDAANQLGVAPSKLSDALKKAEENQIDAAVAAGQLTQAQADRMKAAIESGQAPLVGGGFGRHGFDGGRPGFGRRGFGGPGGDLSAATTYLGVTAAQLATDLQSGKSLADVAKAQGKSVDGLVSALVDAAKKNVEAAVAGGRLTRAQATQLESKLQQQITDRVNGTFRMGPDGEHGFRHGFDDGEGGAGPPSSGGGTGTFGGTTA
jgi:hypothetical protein